MDFIDVGHVANLLPIPPILQIQPKSMSQEISCFPEIIRHYRHFFFRKFCFPRHKQYVNIKTTTLDIKYGGYQYKTDRVTPNRNANRRLGRSKSKNKRGSFMFLVLLHCCAVTFYLFNSCSCAYFTT